MRKSKSRIKSSAKSKLPNRGYREEFYMDEIKSVERPAFIKGALWAVKSEGLELLKFINKNFFQSEGGWVKNDTTKRYLDSEVVELFIKE